MDSDMIYTKRKIDAGADYIVTQMFFNNQKYFEYVDLCRQYGIDVPVVPGLKPITKKYQLKSIPRRFFIDLPDDLVKSIESAKTPDAVKEAGIEWSIHQCKELIAGGAPCLHFYTMGDSETIRRICAAVM
jgi:methylenetetrahydrofolate reductase (NADPH)